MVRRDLGGLTSPVTTQFESRHESHCMVSFKSRQHISIRSFYEEKMNLIESGIQLASINLAWNFSSAILGSHEHQLCHIIFRVIGGFVIGYDHYGMGWLLTTTQISQLLETGSFYNTKSKVLIIWKSKWSKHKTALEYTLISDEPERKAVWCDMNTFF